MFARVRGGGDAVVGGAAGGVGDAEQGDNAMRRRRMDPRLKAQKAAEWDRQKRRVTRGPRRPDWDALPDDDAEIVAVPAGRMVDAVSALEAVDLRVWMMGRLDRLCGRKDHAERGWR
jgi:hypothetical protein